MIPSMGVIRRMVENYSIQSARVVLSSSSAKQKGTSEVRTIQQATITCSQKGEPANS